MEQPFGLLSFTRQLLLSLLALLPFGLQGVFDSLINQRGCILRTAGRMTWVLHIARRSLQLLT